MSDKNDNLAMDDMDEKVQLLPSNGNNTVYYSEGKFEKEKKKNPEASANIFMRITFGWLTSLMIKGFKRPLTEDDLWELQPSNQVDHLQKKFSCEWKKEMIKSCKSPKVEVKKKVEETIDSAEASNSSHTDDKDVSFKPKCTTVSTKQHKYQPSVSKALSKAFGFQYIIAAFLKLLHDGLVFVSPWLLGKVITFIKTGSDDLAWGYGYAAMLFVCATLQSIFLQQYFYLCNMVGMRARSAIIAVVYRKMLNMNSNGRRETTAGEMVNLMSVDSQKCFDLLLYLNLVWSGPAQVVGALCYLYYIMGWSVIAGFLITVLVVPLNTIATNKEKEYTFRKMKEKDERSKLMNEILNNIKILKLYTWEESFIERVMGFRRSEMKELRKAKILKANYTFVITMVPFLVSFATFGIYVALGNDLTAEKAFVAISLFNIIRFPLFILPQVVSNFAQFMISANRIKSFLQSEELEFDEVKRERSEKDEEQKETVAYIENGNFYWTEAEQPVLKDINVSFKRDSLTAIVGQVGAGKSSFLSALLGEIMKQSGEVAVFGKIAYVAQQPWIQNTTLRENVLFGKPYVKEKYDRIIEACSLKSDLELLPGGDLTEIGEKGINLSGGQKQRVALARAVYNNADIYIFDDPLSAVDVHVGKHIFDNVFGRNGILKTKTRIMVTHNLTFLPWVDRIIVLKNGKISEAGTFRELSSSDGSEFAEFLNIYLKDYMVDDEENEDPSKSKGKVFMRLESLDALQPTHFEESFSKQITEKSYKTNEDKPYNQVDYVPQSAEEVEMKMALDEYVNIEIDASKTKKAMIFEEKTETGRVKRSVFGVYAKSLGIIFTTLVLFFAFGYQACLVGTRLWLAKWSSEYNVTDQTYYLNIYGAIGGGQAACLWIQNVLFAYCTIKASILLHDSLLMRMMRAPMSFFETTPMGRVVNRFSKDIHIIDEQIPQSLNSFIGCLMTMFGTLFVISYSTPIFLSVLVPIGFIYFFTQRFYVASSRQLKRIESVKRSPIYNHFFESIYGASTIRAFGYKEKFIEENIKKVDVDQAAWFPSLCANRWLAIRIEFAGNLITLFAAIFCIVNRDSISPGIAGLSVSYALQVTQTLNWLVRMTSELETNIISVERVKEYIDTPSEAAWEIKESKPSDKWPSDGEVGFRDYSVRYREGLDLALKDISCNIQGNEKIGIVGRTGAGKSTLTSTLFRIIEAAGGKIFIDGIDIATLGLKDLRSKLTVIPQEPVLFSGSVRFNLDPFSVYSDEEVWNALRVAHLSNFVSDLKEGLQHEIVEGGENLSIGQRQLICLGRALLRKTKILILDEATAAVDMETDAFIQKTIREEFKDSTILTIAHRLHTIIDYDKIMVLSSGELKEFAPPDELMADKTSIFYGMAKDAGLTKDSI